MNGIGWNNDGAYIRRYYGVPAHPDTRVVADGKPGVISGFDGPYLLVLLDGQAEPAPWHPTWRMTYLPPAAGP